MRNYARAIEAHEERDRKRAPLPSPPEDILEVAGEETAGQALGHLVVDGNGMLQAAARHDVQNGRKGFVLHN